MFTWGFALRAPPQVITLRAFSPAEWTFHCADTSSLLKNFVINLSHLLAEFPERLAELLGRGKPAPD